MKNRRYTMITNPQGLTKSERKEYRREVYETVMLRDQIRKQEEERGNKEGGAAGGEDTLLAEKNDEASAKPTVQYKSVFKKKGIRLKNKAYEATLFEDSDLDPDYDNREDCPSGPYIPRYYQSDAEDA